MKSIALICGRYRRYFFDTPFAVVLLLGAFPFLLLASIAIWMETPGFPVFFQKRGGLGGRTFTIFKLRTMRTESDKRLVYDEETDPRITKVGRFLRATKSDELLQLVNVIKGDMNLVGWRPKLPEAQAAYASALPNEPGMTGLSQLLVGAEAHDCGGSEEVVRRRCRNQMRLDRFYATHRSTGFDLVIIYWTARYLWPRFTKSLGRPEYVPAHPVHAAE